MIPGNDDALRAVRLFASRIADAIVEGNQIATEGGVLPTEPGEESAEGEAAATSEGAAGGAIATALGSDEDVNGGVSGGEAQSASMTSQSAEAAAETQSAPDESTESVVAAS